MVVSPHHHPLLAARLRERFSQQLLADTCGVRRVRVQAIEGGARPSRIEAMLLAACLRIPVADLLPPDVLDAPQPTTEAEVRDGGT